MKMLDAPAWLMLLGALLSTAGAIWASQRQAASEEDLRNKSDEIARLNKQIAASVTGGDSFAYMVFLLQFDVPRLVLIHEGAYPLYDVSVRISDIDKTKDRKYSISDLENELHFNIGNVAPHNSRMLVPIPLSNDSLRWNIFFSARNGFFTEILRMRRINNKWKTALKVVTNGSNGEVAKTLFEKVDPDYPVGENGQVDWK
jgi:hypothetical protein